MRKSHFLRIIRITTAVVILLPVVVTLIWSVTERWPWPNLLPESYTEICIEKDLEKGFDYRRITVTEVE